MRILTPERASIIAAGFFFVSALVFTSSGCTSPMVNVTIVNHGPDVKLVEFDYPNASFGIDDLKSGGRFEYPIKVLGSGPVTLHFKDKSGVPHSSTGPAVHGKVKGSLTAAIEASGDVSWQTGFSGSK